MRLSRVILKLALPIGLGFAASLIICGVLSWVLISHGFQKQFKDEINVEFHILNQHTNRLKVVAIIDAIDYRLSQNTTGPQDWIYLLIDADGDIVTGNLPAWPDAKPPDAKNWVRFSSYLEGKKTPIIARCDDIDGYYKLLIGRSLAPSQQFKTMVALVLASVGLVTFILLGLTVSLAGARLTSRLSTITDAIDAFRTGNRSARINDIRGDEISDLSDRVDNMLSTLERQMNYLRKLSGVMAHEFRTPLSRIKTHLTSVIEAADTPTTPVIESLEQVDGLLTLSRQLLEIAEHETSFSSPVEPCDLADILKSTRPLFEDLAENNHVTLNWNLKSTVVHGEKWLLIRLVSNLVENAIEAAPPGGAVTCACHHAGNAAILEIRDNGPGVAASSLEELITLTARKSKADTHGIGLKMVRAIALRHGARVELKNTFPGLIVRISFPLWRDPRTPASPH